MGWQSVLQLAAVSVVCCWWSNSNRQDSVYITQPSENHLYVWTSLKLIVVTTVEECSVYSVVWVCGGVDRDIVKNKSSTFLPLWKSLNAYITWISLWSCDLLTQHYPLAGLPWQKAGEHRKWPWHVCSVSLSLGILAFPLKMPIFEQPNHVFSHNASDYSQLSHSF